MSFSRGQKQLAAILLTVAVLAFLGLASRGRNSSKYRSLKQDTSAGLFVRLPQKNYTEITDAAGRTLALVPAGSPRPEGFSPVRTIRIPPRRVVAAAGQFDVGLISGLGFGRSVIGVTEKKEKWHLSEIKEGLESGRVTFLGSETALDYERLRTLEPDLILSPGGRAGTFLEQLDWPAIQTYTPKINDLTVRLKFVDLMAAIFQRPEVAASFRQNLTAAVDEIQRKVGSAEPTPVMWVYVGSRNFYVEPGNNWVGEIVSQIGGDYLFSKTLGDSTVPVTTEYFLDQGSRAVVMIVYPFSEQVFPDKKALLKFNSYLQKIEALGTGGRVYAVNSIFYQSFGRLDEIVRELAAILHPEIFANQKLLFFREIK
ncbi:MAG: ABC transporter substrate-binding protein [Deltaproteobacteria bacterium]|nr:ABC transporter substrate-binding protein [Deltaproteobacteria bacterium]